MIATLEAAARMPMWALTAYAMSFGCQQEQAEAYARAILDSHTDEEPSLESLRGMYREMRERLWIQR